MLIAMTLQFALPCCFVNIFGDNEARGYLGIMKQEMQLRI